MKRKMPVAELRSASNVESTAQEMSGPNTALEEHRTLMSRGELIFCLRDVHSYWSTPRISLREMEELEQQNLIQRRVTGICAIRLTEQGARLKERHLPKKP